VTDSDGEIRYDPDNKPGVSNLLSILAALSGGNVEAIAAELDGKGYGALKERAIDCVTETLAPIQAEYARIMADKATLQTILDRNAAEASRRANRTLDKVRRKVGCAPRGKA
jgi:tryptophanyl-tRNA synthetase